MVANRGGGCSNPSKSLIKSVAFSRPHLSAHQHPLATYDSNAANQLYSTRARINMVPVSDPCPLKTFPIGNQPRATILLECNWQLATQLTIPNLSAPYLDYCAQFQKKQNGEKSIH